MDQYIKVKEERLEKYVHLRPLQVPNFSQVSLHLEIFRKVDSRTSYISKYFMFASIYEIENYQFRCNTCGLDGTSNLGENV